MSNNNADYDLADHVETEYRVPDPEEWTVLSETFQELVWEHNESGRTVRLTQERPEGTDLPFHVEQKPVGADEYGLISQHDWLGDALRTVETALTMYAAGYSDATQSE